MALSRIVAPSSQKRLVDPYQQRVFQYDTQSSDVFLSRVVNSLYNIFGNNIVTHGFQLSNLQLTNNDKDIMVTVDPGMLIQDSTLLEFPENTTLYLPNASSLDSDGKFIIHTRYQYLETIEKNDAYLCINHISQAGYPTYEFNADTDKIILAIIDFTKDDDDNLTSLTLSTDKTITIAGTQYTLFGFDTSKVNLERYFEYMLTPDSASSIEWIKNEGLQFKGDINLPGSEKYYGTNDTGVKGWYNFPASVVINDPESVDFIRLRDVPDTYSGKVGTFVKVNSYGNGLSFEEVNIPSPDDFVTVNTDQDIVGSKIFEGDVVFKGDIIIEGTQSTVNEATLDIQDNKINLNVGETGEGVTSIYAGLYVKRGTLPDAYLRFNEIMDRWYVGFAGGTAYKILTSQDLAEIQQSVFTITDSGTVSEYTGKQYNFKVINGNIVLEQIV